MNRQIAQEVFCLVENSAMLIEEMEETYYQI